MCYSQPRSSTFAAVVGAATLAMLSGVSAQTVLIGGNPEAQSAGFSPDNLFQWGPVKLHPRVNYSFTVGTGLQSSPGQSEDSIVQTVSPGMLFNMGDHWTVDYSPSLTFYSNDRFKDSVNHSVSLSWGTTYEEWVFALSHRFSATSDPQIETGQQTDMQAHNTSISAAHQLGSKASWNASLNQDLRLASGFNSSRQWSGSTGFNYQFWPRFSAGISVNAGYADVDLGSDMTFEGLQGQMHWQPTDKLYLEVNAGGQIRQFLDLNTDDLISPTFGGSLSYHPFEFTTLSLTASHGVNPSLFSSQVTESTTFGASLQQRLFKHFQLGLSGGYHSGDFISTTPGLPTVRSDSGFNLGANLGFSFLKRGNFSVFYNYHENNSDQTGFAFASHQYGFQIGYRL